MKKLKLFLLLPFLYACSNECEGIDCLSQDYFSFTIKAAEGGEDLLFGDNPQIGEGDLRVFYMLDNKQESAFFRFERERVTVSLNKEVEEYFVSALEKIDTLRVLSARREASECCPATTEIQKIQVNGSEVSDSWRVIDLYR